MEDSKIIELFQARSERAIIELSKKYGTVCTQIAKNILNNALDAEECVNDAYLGAWNTIPPQSPNPLRTYIYRIVRNLSIKKYHENTSIKRNSYYDVALDELENCLPFAKTVEDEVLVKELAQNMDEFLDTLDRENRVMFVRRYWYADSISEIAKRFHMSNNNVSVRLLRTREKLKIYLRKEGFEI
ncbi:MAG: sigma-70 family RNA polymerase sigma factor [Lachnospiraceae bacterium]|nr:sigma-70 family RNA polymerase sigma factor [Lachnospiraceae bacterium]